MLIDSHCHLLYETLTPHTDTIIACAKNSDVNIMLNVAVTPDEFNGAIALAEKYEEVYTALGIDPHDAHKFSNYDFSELEKLAAHPKVIGIGETGLDYYYGAEHKKVQKVIFEKQLQLAKKLDLPVIIHTRDADDDTYEMIKTAGNAKGVIHCFTAGKKFAHGILDLGFYISFSGIITFDKTLDLRETAKFIPLNRILIETDSPYLAPKPNRGKTNEPANVKYVAEFLAKLRNEKFEKIAEQTSANFHKLFKIQNL